MKEGIEACFAAVNARGGIEGRKLELVALGDGYETDAAVANARRSAPRCCARRRW
jgi:ABC-type branched-subunit amino acid transport system substrate-binding protein